MNKACREIRADRAATRSGGLTRQIAVQAIEAREHRSSYQCGKIYQNRT